MEKLDCQCEKLMKINHDDFVRRLQRAMDLTEKSVSAGRVSLKTALSAANRIGWLEAKEFAAWMYSDSLVMDERSRRLDDIIGKRQTGLADQG